MSHELLFNLFIDLSLISLPVSLAISREKSLRKAVNWLGLRQMPLSEMLKKTGLLFLALVAASIWLSIALSWLGLNDLELVAESLGEMKGAIPLFFWIVILRVISEEVFFRGYLVKKAGVIASSAIFAAFHVGYGSVAEIIGAFILGLVLAKAFQLNKNLYPNILAHAVYNSVAMLALWA